MVFNDVIEKIGMIIDAAGVVVIVTGAAVILLIAAWQLAIRVRPRLARAAAA